MKLEGVKALLFDWHGVLDLRRFKGIEDRLAEFTGLNSADLKVLHGRADDYARGTMSSEEFWKFVGDYYNLNQRIVREDFQSYFISVDELNDPLWNSLSDLSKKYKLAILSDCPPDKTELIKGKVDLRIFEGRTYFSSDYGLTKRDSGFFELAVRGLEFLLNGCLFIDDSPKNVEYARNTGLQGYLYEDNDEFLRLVA